MASVGRPLSAHTHMNRTPQPKAATQGRYPRPRRLLDAALLNHQQRSIDPSDPCVIILQEYHRLANSFGETPMNVKSLQLVSLSAIAAAAFAASAFAHHSFAMFDSQQTVTLDGTVKEFEWVNPHSWLRVMVKDEKAGQQVMWALELSSPSRLVTMGMRADSVKP